MNAPGRTAGRRALGWLGTLTSTLLAAASAQAHKPGDAYLSLHVDGARIEARWDLHLRDLDRELALDADGDRRLRWGEVRSRWPQIEAAAWPALELDAGAAQCRPLPAAAAPSLDDHSDGAYAVLHRSWACAAPPQALRIGYRLFAAGDPTHRGILRIDAPALRTPLAAVLDPAGEPQRWVLAAPSPLQALGSFTAEGVRHIWMGFDHLLFLLSLLLPAVLVRQDGRWVAAREGRAVLLDVLRVVTAFTVAHSITLALAVLGIVQPPARWVESVIAASVVLAALNNLRPVVGGGRWLLTFAFGLVHGFGFAGALRDLGLQHAPLGWALLGFNLGVEAGQLAVVAAFVPLAWWLRTRRAYRVVGLQLGSLAIAGLAALWFVERAFDWPLGLPV